MGEETLTCTYTDCKDDATRIMAMPPMVTVRCLFAATYCAEHAAEVADMGGWPVSGPAVSEAASKIEGIR